MPNSRALGLTSTRKNSKPRPYLSLCRNKLGLPQTAGLIALVLAARRLQL